MEGRVKRKRPGLPAGALSEVLCLKEPERSRTAMERCEEHGYDEGWAIRDGAIVIYNLDDPPAWLPALEDEFVTCPECGKPNGATEKCDACILFRHEAGNEVQTSA